ncbi:MAG: hypothetical protein ABI880_10140, partial [Acidobacteriota bacterium]
MFVAVALAAPLLLANTAFAQLTTCAMTGEYVLAASGSDNGVPGQLGGTLVFTPPATCAVNAVGVVAISVSVTSGAGAASWVYQTSLPYRFDGTLLHIGEGSAVAGLSGVVSGIASSAALVAGPAEVASGLTLAGTLTRRTLDGLTGAGAPGPAGPIGPMGPQGSTGI